MNCHNGQAGSASRYRCRRCAVQFNGPVSPIKDQLTNRLRLENLLAGEAYEAHTLQLEYAHECTDGGVGIGVLLGIDAPCLEPLTPAHGEGRQGVQR